MKTGRNSSRGFTLIEIMVVVGVMGIILAMGVPSILKSIKREGMRKAVADVEEVCSNARARAILGGSETTVVFHPLEKRLEVGGAAPVPTEGGGDGDAFPVSAPAPASTRSSGLSAVLPDEITIEMLDINLLEYNESEVARIRFFPNGTSDEMTLILHSSKRNEYFKVSTEVTTGLVSSEPFAR
jgi:prepilin-type N-terminal cleavage/methylation domain-containing protein